MDFLTLLSTIWPWLAIFIAAAVIDAYINKAWSVVGFILLCAIIAMNVRAPVLSHLLTYSKEELAEGLGLSIFLGLLTFTMAVVWSTKRT